MSSTVALAKKLGLARIRKLDGSSSSNKNLDNKQKLEYILVIDFESTCWSEKANSPSPEIIEFPVVLLSLTTGKVVSEFHSYCLPVEHPKLSPFCTQLTGITQAMVEGGVPLPTCLVLFRQWLESVCKELRMAVNGENMGKVEGELNQATCLTWSDWDLSICLEYECKRKQIRKPVCLNSWIDIRGVYRSFYNRRPQGLNGALRELGLSFQGREHSGIEDARNTAMLVWKMVEGGCELEVTGTTGGGNTGVKQDVGVRNLPGAAAAKDKQEQSPRRSKWRNFKNTPHVIPTGKEAVTESPTRQSKRLKVTHNHDHLHIPNQTTPKTPSNITPATPKLPSKLNDSGYSSPHLTNPLVTKFVARTPVLSKLATLLQQTTPTREREDFICINTLTRPHPDSTPPLCVCGRRARRRQVAKIGPNTGRIFWSCPLKGGNTRAGCNYFLWAAEL